MAIASLKVDNGFIRRDIKNYRDIFSDLSLEKQRFRGNFLIYEMYEMYEME